MLVGPGFASVPSIVGHDDQHIGSGLRVFAGEFGEYVLIADQRAGGEGEPATGSKGQ